MGILILLTLTYTAIADTETPSAFTFRGYPWGTAESVIVADQAGEPIERTELGIVYQGTIAGLPAKLLYFTWRGQLYGGGYSFATSGWHLQDNLSDYRLIGDILRDKYGEADTITSTGTDPDTRTAIWDRDGTEILHTLRRIEGKPEHLLRYLHQPTAQARKQAQIEAARDGF